LKDKILYLNTLKERADQRFPLKREWDEVFLEKLKIELTYHSNKIEGNTLTYGDTLQYLKTGLLNPKKPGKDYIDIKHHQEVLDKIFSTYNEPISEALIKNIHYQLLRSPDQWNCESFYSPGVYKIRDNYVIEESGKLHKFLPSEQVPEAMKNLASEINVLLEEADLNEMSKHPVNIAAYFHHKFINIHPFEDGNGRVVRIFSNVILLKNGFTPFVINENERLQYFSAIKATSDKDIEPTANFFTDKIINSLELRLGIFRDGLPENYFGL
jgi:Fic family protein